MVCTDPSYAEEGVVHGMRCMVLRLRGYGTWYAAGHLPRERVLRMVCSGCSFGEDGSKHGMQLPPFCLE
jgi:hypothetical protein